MYMNVYRLGDLVHYSRPIRFLPSPIDELIGVVVGIEGTKWYKVRWSDKFTCVEHMHDLELISRSS